MPPYTKVQFTSKGYTNHKIPPPHTHDTHIWQSTWSNFVDNLFSTRTIMLINSDLINSDLWPRRQMLLCPQGNMCALNSTIQFAKSNLHCKRWPHMQNALTKLKCRGQKGIMSVIPTPVVKQHSALAVLYMSELIMWCRKTWDEN